MADIIAVFLVAFCLGIACCALVCQQLQFKIDSKHQEELESLRGKHREELESLRGKLEAEKDSAQGRLHILPTTSGLPPSAYRGAYNEVSQGETFKMLTQRIEQLERKQKSGVA